MKDRSNIQSKENTPNTRKKIVIQEQAVGYNINFIIILIIIISLIIALVLYRVYYTTNSTSTYIHPIPTVSTSTTTVSTSTPTVSTSTTTASTSSSSTKSTPTVSTSTTTASTSSSSTTTEYSPSVVKRVNSILKSADSVNVNNDDVIATGRAVEENVLLAARTLELSNKDLTHKNVPERSKFVYQQFMRKLCALVNISYEEFINLPTKEQQRDMLQKVISGQISDIYVNRNNETELLRIHRLTTELQELNDAYTLFQKKGVTEPW